MKQALIALDLAVANFFARIFGSPTGHTISGHMWRLIFEGKFGGYVLLPLLLVTDIVAWGLHTLFGIGQVPHCRWVYEREVAARDKAQAQR